MGTAHGEKIMEAKFTLRARIEGEFKTVKEKKGEWIDPGVPASYTIRFTDPVSKKRITRSVGFDFAEAVREIKNHIADRAAVAAGRAPAVAVDAEETSGSLAQEIDTFLEDDVRVSLRRKTYLAYKRDLRYFKQSCTKTMLSQVRASDLKAFKKFLADPKLDFAARTQHNVFTNVMHFLNEAGVKLDQDVTAPKFVPRRADIYTDQELDALREVADPEQRLLIDCLLFTGLRVQELAFSTYNDIDFDACTWKVQAKENWVGPKTAAGLRDIPIHTLAARLKKRMEANHRTKDDLIFFNSEGTPNLHILRIIKRVAKKAGVTGRVDNHKFRATAITRWLLDGVDIYRIMYWVGHTNANVILAYYKRVNAGTKEAQESAGKTFQRFQAMAGD